MLLKYFQIASHTYPLPIDDQMLYQVNISPREIAAAKKAKKKVDLKKRWRQQIRERGLDVEPASPRASDISNEGASIT